MLDDDPTLLRALLEWQFDLGVTEAIADAPVNRYEAAQPVLSAAPVAPPPVPGVGPVQQATDLAAGAGDLAALRVAMAGFDGCELKRGARQLVFADGNPGAAVMVIGEAPGREEDQQGRPFVGPAGQLLDRMFAAIGLSRGAEAPRAIYITNILPWRPPQNREPTPDEVAMMMPFVARHVALVAPRVVVVMGNVPLAGVLGQRGITKLRGVWGEAFGLPVLPMVHPAYLLRNPVAKREAWADLQALQASLRPMGLA